jgi:hypothetical protein
MMTINGLLISGLACLLASSSDGSQRKGSIVVDPLSARCIRIAEGVARSKNLDIDKYGIVVRDEGVTVVVIIQVPQPSNVRGNAGPPGLEVVIQKADLQVVKWYYIK